MRGHLSLCALRLLVEPDVYAAGCAAENLQTEMGGRTEVYSQALASIGERKILSQSWPYQVLSFIERCT